MYEHADLVKTLRKYQCIKSSIFKNKFHEHIELKTLALNMEVVD